MVLQYYLKTGTCKFGATCKFHHPRDKAGIAGRVSLNILGYPLRPVRFFISLYSCYWNWFECANHVRIFISPSLDSPNFGTLISFFLLFHFFFLVCSYYCIWIFCLGAIYTAHRNRTWIWTMHPRWYKMFWKRKAWWGYIYAEMYLYLNEIWLIYMNFWLQMYSY